MKRILQHVGAKDFKKTHQRKLDEQEVLCKIEREKQLQEKKEIEEIKKLSAPLKCDWRSELRVEEECIEKVEEVRVNVKVPEKLKSNWRNELSEAMTTSGLIAVTLNPTDAPLTALDGGDTASFNNDNGGPNLGSDNDGLSGCAVVSSGTGSGSDGGFNLGQNYLAFNQSSFDDGDEAGTQNLRFAVMAPMDASKATTLDVTAIVGNDSNGGNAPESGEDIVLAYASGENSYTTIKDDQGNDTVVVPYNGSESLRTYSVTIPTDYRIPNISFILVSRQNTISLSNELTQDNYGITEIKLKRTVPASVFVSLDSPEATNFIRTDPIMQGLSAEGRRKRLEDMLDAGNEYLVKQLGMQGSIARPADTGNIVSWQQAASGITPITGTGGITRIGGTGTTRTNTSRTSSSKSKSTSIFGNPSSRSRTFGSFGGRAFGTTSSRFGPSQSISSTGVSQQLYKNDLKAAGYSDKQIAQKTNVRYIAAKKNTETAKAKYDALLAKASTSKTPVDLTKAKQDYEDASAREFAAMMGRQSTEYSKQVADEISKAVAAARAEYLKSGQTVAQRQQSYDKLQAAIKAGTDYANQSNRSLTQAGIAAMKLQPGFEDWWNRGRNVRIPNENVAPWDLLRADDKAQMGKFLTPEAKLKLKNNPLYQLTDADFTGGPIPKNLDQLKDFLQGKGGSTWSFTRGLETGPTPLGRQAVERPLRKIVPKGAARLAGRAVPFAGAALSAADMVDRYSKGDIAGGTLSGLSAVPGPVGWAALGGQMAYDAVRSGNLPKGGTSRRGQGSRTRKRKKKQNESTVWDRTKKHLKGA